MPRRREPHRTSGIYLVAESSHLSWKKRIAFFFAFFPSFPRPSLCLPRSLISHVGWKFRERFVPRGSALRKRWGKRWVFSFFFLLFGDQRCVSKKKNHEENKNRPFALSFPHPNPLRLSLFLSTQRTKRKSKLENKKNGKRKNPNSPPRTRRPLPPRPPPPLPSSSPRRPPPPPPACPSPPSPPSLPPHFPASPARSGTPASRSRRPPRAPPRTRGPKPSAAHLWRGRRCRCCRCHCRLSLHRRRRRRSRTGSPLPPLRARASLRGGAGRSRASPATGSPRQSRGSG